MKLLETLLSRKFEKRQIEAFQQVINEIVIHSNRYNLVSKGDLPNLLERHMADSLVLEPYILNKHKIVDLGSGAGLPGVPLAIMHPEMSFYLVEPRKKRVNFLKHIKRTLKLDNISIFESRIEELEGLISEVDCIVTRGVGGLASIIGSIKERFQPGLDLFVLTSRAKTPERIQGLGLKIMNYNLADSSWGGTIWHFHVPRETV